MRKASRLASSACRVAHRVEASSLIIKEASTVAQVFNRPACNFPGQAQRFVIELAAFEESYDCTGCGMRIRRIKIVIVVFRPTIRKKEVALPILEAALKSLLKFIFSYRVDYALQREEYVSSVEVVDPGLLWFSAVQP